MFRSVAFVRRDPLMPGFFSRQLKKAGSEFKRTGLTGQQAAHRQARCANLGLGEAAVVPVPYRGRSEDLKEIALVIGPRTDMTQRLVAGLGTGPMKMGTTGPAGPLLKRHLQAFEHRALCDIHGILVADVDAEATPGTTLRADQVGIPTGRQSQRIMRTDAHTGIAAVAVCRVDRRYRQGEITAPDRREKLPRWTPPLVAIIRLQLRGRSHHTAEKTAPAHLCFGDIPAHAAGPPGRVVGSLINQVNHGQPALREHPVDQGHTVRHARGIVARTARAIGGLQRYTPQSGAV